MTTCRQCGSEMQEGVKVCPTCGSTLTASGTGSAQAALPGVSVRQWAIRLTLGAVLIIGVGAFVDQLLRTYHPVIEHQPTVAMVTMYRDEQIRSTSVEAIMQQGNIAVPLKLIQEHKLVRFFDPEGIQEVPMIAYVTPQGKLVTAMSKSEHCGSTDFYLSGNNIHCASCASYWNMASMEAYACCQRYYPDPVPSVVSGEMVLIEPVVVRGWKSRL